jgi:hypothetical protein
VEKVDVLERVGTGCLLQLTLSFALVVSFITFVVVGLTPFFNIVIFLFLLFVALTFTNLRIGLILPVVGIVILIANPPTSFSSALSLWSWYVSACVRTVFSLLFNSFVVGPVDVSSANY